MSDQPQKKSNNWAEGTIQRAFDRDVKITTREPEQRFDEGGHPRAADGKFGAGSGGAPAADADKGKADGKLKLAIGLHKQNEKEHEAAQADHDMLAKNQPHADTMKKARERLDDAKSAMEDSGKKLKATADAHPDQAAANALMAKHGMIRKAA